MTAPLKGQPVSIKLLVLLLIVMVSLFVFSMAAVALIPVVFGMTLAEALAVLSHPDDPKSINALKFMQLFNAIGVFIVPPIIFVLLATKEKLKYLWLNKSGNPLLYLLVPAIMIGALPMINFLAEINKLMSLPEFLSGLENWMKEAEASAERVTKAFLQVNTIEGLLYNLLLIAIIPAVGEELLFRGVIQKLLIKGTNNIHWGIWIAAILFSALHMQFYGFLPRTVMGALLGYLMVWGGSLWLPIFAHFVNNGSAVVASFLIHKGILSPDIENIGEGDGAMVSVIISAVLVFPLLWFYHHISKEKVQEV
jgi:uncharacterized protein